MPAIENVDFSCIALIGVTLTGRVPMIAVDTEQ